MKLTARILVAIVVLLPVVVAMRIHRQRSLAKSGYSIVYAGGTLSDVKPGTRLQLRITPRESGSQILLSSRNNTVAYLPSNSVTGLSYRQSANFLSLSWYYGQDILAIPFGEGWLEGRMLLLCPDSDAVAALEQATGQRARRLD